MDRREEIYEKAMELFIAEGYDQTPLSKIAKAFQAKQVTAISE